MDFERFGHKNCVNITCGEIFNAFFEKNFKLKGFPFNEAMMFGEVKGAPFSDDFIKNRAKVLAVDIAYYKNKLNGFILATSTLSIIDTIYLWFGEDCFCTINLLTILAYLERIGFLGQIFIVIIDEADYSVKQSPKRVYLGSFLSLYNAVLLEEKIIDFKENEYFDRGIKLYFDYKNPNGKLASFIKSNKMLDKPSLIQKILKNSTKYGITDLMAEELVKKLA